VGKPSPCASVVAVSGEVSTLAGNGEEGFEDGQGEAARFNCPCGVALAANDDMADTENHAIRVVTPAAPCARRQRGGWVCRRAGRRSAFQPPIGPGAGQGREHSGDRQGQLRGAAGDNGGGGDEVITVAGNGEASYADGEGAAARFNDPLRATARARRRRAVRTTRGRDAQRWSWRCIGRRTCSRRRGC
jgi:serine/threonine protein kinase, bacterial